MKTNIHVQHINCSWEWRWVDYDSLIWLTFCHGLSQTPNAKLGILPKPNKVKSNESCWDSEALTSLIIDSVTNPKQMFETCHTKGSTLLGRPNSSDSTTPNMQTRQLQQMLFGNPPPLPHHMWRNLTLPQKVGSRGEASIVSMLLDAPKIIPSGNRRLILWVHSTQESWVTR